MSRVTAVVLWLLCPMLWCAGQVAAPVPAQPSPQTPVLRIIARGHFPLKVTRTLDSSRLKKGDLIELETAGDFRLRDGRLVPKGSKVEGHVEVATARSNGDEQSVLGIVFDTINVRKDGQLKVKGLVQAVFPPAEGGDPGVVNGYTMAAESGPGYLPPDIKIGSNLESAEKVQQGLDLNFAGVRGIHDLELKPGGLLSSPKGQRVKLGDDVRLVVKAIVLG